MKKVTCEALEKLGISLGRNPSPSCNPSGLCMLRQCPRKYLFKYRWQIQPKLSKSKAASLGSILHALLKTEARQAEVDQVVRGVEEEIQTHMNIVSSGNDLIGQALQVAMQQRENLDKAMGMAKLFWEMFPPEELAAKMVFVCRETPMKAVIRGAHGQYAVQGTPDSVVRGASDDSLWIRDTKTTSRNKEAVSSGYGWGIARSIYRLLVTRHCKQAPTGIILDILRVPSIKFCKKDKNFEAYLKRVKEWYAENSTKVIESVAFRYTEEPLTEALDMILATGMTAAERETDNPDAFPMDWSGATCYQYMRRCPYYEFCDGDPVRWPGLIGLSGHFDIRASEEIARENEEEPE